MANRSKEVHRTALPLLRRINDRKLTRKKVADHFGIDVQNVTNWLSRGVPASKMPGVAELCGLSTDLYRLEAGLSKGLKGVQSTLDTPAYLADFEALPAGLQTYIAMKTAQLRTLYEGFPTWLRDKLVPPKDPQQYLAWERDIEGLISKFRPPTGEGQ